MFAILFYLSRFISSLLLNTTFVFKFSLPFALSVIFTLSADDACNSDCKKYLHIIKANNLINLRKTSKHFPNAKKGKTFSPAYFFVLLCRSPPLSPQLPNLPPSWRYQNMPTDNWEVSHLCFSFLYSCNAFSLFPSIVAPSLSLPVSLFFACSLLSVGH